MAVPAVAARIDRVGVGVLRDLECARLVLVQRPEMVFAVEPRIDALRLVRAEFRVEHGEQFAVAQRRDVRRLFLARRAVARECPDFRARLHDGIADAGHLVDVSPRDRRHDERAHAARVDHRDGRERRLVRAGPPEPVMRRFKAVDGQLVAAAAEAVHPRARFRRQVEGIAHDREGNLAEGEQLEERPEIGMENRITARQVQVGLATVDRAEIVDLVEDGRHVLPAHRGERLFLVPRENIAMLAALVACFRDVPLKGKIGLLQFTCRPSRKPSS